MPAAVTASPAQDLAESEMFEGVAAAGVSAALRTGRIGQLSQNQTIFDQGEPAERAHVLLKGRIRIAQGDPKGEQLLVRFIGAGEIFGTIGLLTDRIYPAQAVAVAPSTEISWGETELLQLISAYPRIAINLVKITGRRLGEAQERLREVATQRLERRIANLLLRLARQAGERTKSGTAISFPLSRKDIAEMCGATIHSVSRTLAAWEKAGTITTDQQMVTIRVMTELLRRAED